MDTQEDTLEMKQKHGLSFPVLADASKDLLDEYGVFYHGEDAPYKDHGNHGEEAYFY